MISSNGECGFVESRRRRYLKRNIAILKDYHEDRDDKEDELNEEKVVAWSVT